MIPIAGPSITEKEIEYVKQAVTDSWYGNAGAWVRRFEEQMATYTGRKCGVATNSCTAALHLALKAMDIRHGDEVIVPDATWIATAAPVVYMGATPIFADIDARTWCLDCKSVESLITRRTKAIIGVDLYGAMPNWSGLQEIADGHNLWLIEDAAQAIGSSLYGIRAGGHGDVSVFSFHGTKTLTTGGEGGMLLVDGKAFADRVRYYQGHCRADDRMFWNTDVGYKYKMTDMQAAMGCAQLERIDTLVEKKAQIFSWYQVHLLRCGLKPNMNITTNHAQPFTNSYWMTTIDYRGLSPKPKEWIIKALCDRGVVCRPFFYPLSSMPAFDDLIQYQMFKNTEPTNSTAYGMSRQSINLPSALSITEEQVMEVCKALKECL